jgi:drug/metabolite transporter (DMT)-like permease
MNRLSIVLPLVLLVSALGSVGQTLLKLAINRLPAGTSVAQAIPVLLQSGTFWAGGLITTAGSVTWLYVLSRAHISYAMPFLGLGMVMTVATSVVILHEPLIPARVFGTIVVAVGLAFVART